MRYTLYIYDISDISKPQPLKELYIDADSKEDAQDKGYNIAFELFPNIKRMIKINKN